MVQGLGLVHRLLSKTAGVLEFSTLSAVIDRRYSSRGDSGTHPELFPIGNSSGVRP